MRDKILELLRSDNPQSVILGIELAKVQKISIKREMFNELRRLANVFRGAFCNGDYVFSRRSNAHIVIIEKYSKKHGYYIVARGIDNTSSVKTLRYWLTKYYQSKLDNQ